LGQCLSLPGCISQGETKEAAIENIRDAIKAYIEVLKEDGLAVPPEKFSVTLVKE
jgi:predicted RNase H-like HicB family nuclease